MSLVNKIVSQSIDNAYYASRDNKSCKVFIEKEEFDGKHYSIDAFFDQYKKYFDRPEEFYLDFAYEGAPNLREGFHFNARDKTHALKYHYQPMLFDSPIKTKWQETNLVPFRWFKNETKKSNTILLFSPGWARPNLEMEKGFCKRLIDSGIDAGLLTKPYHQERTPAGSYSGEYFISGNVFWTIENFRHYVAEIRLLIQYMRQHYEYIGIVGMSSGGLQASLAITVEKVDFYFPFVTGAELGSIVWKSKICKQIVHDLKKRGIDEAMTNKIWAIGDQLYLGQHIKTTYLKQYISLYDKVIPTKHQFLLWNKYNRPEKLELECAHVSVILHMEKVANDIISFVKEKIGKG